MYVCQYGGMYRYTSVQNDMWTRAMLALPAVLEGISYCRDFFAY